MKRPKIPTEIKLKVAERANFRCEYCHLPEKVSFYSFHIDHIKSIKHGGVSQLNNLAFCCPDCNSFKGSDIGSFTENDEIIRFFNPRKDKWQEHFDLIEGMILSKTAVAQVTERIFKFNEIERLIFRRQIIQQNQYNL